MTVYRLGADVLRASVPNDSGGQDEVLLNVGTGQYHLINSTGRTVLEALEAGDDLSVAVQRLVERGAPPERVETDVAAFVAGLEQRGLLAATTP